MPDAEAAVVAGVDALGLVFFDASPRAVNLSTAAEIANGVSCFVDVVGVFVNPLAREVENVLNNVPLTLLQFHGEETLNECERFGIPYIKTVRMQRGVDPGEVARTHPSARAILLDTYHPKIYGGTGKSFPWEQARMCQDKPIILAGGLTDQTVSQALSLSNPYAVDISTGVEVVPGVKDILKIRTFVQAVAKHDSEKHSISRG